MKADEGKRDDLVVGEKAGAEQKSVPDVAMERSTRD